MVRIDAVIADLVRRRAAADADFEAAVAEMVEHADFFREPQRMMRRQDVDQCAEAKPPGALGCGGQKYARRRRKIERRRMCSLMW